MSDAAPTLSDQISCVKRELAMRPPVYARRVADGRMKQAKADFEIAAMHAVLKTLEAVAEKERLL